MNGADPQADAAALAGLAREVEALRLAVEKLNALPKRVEQLAELVAGLGEATAARSRKKVTEGVASWLALPAETAEAMALLEELLEWLERVYLRYADAAATLPECWLWHPDVIEELLWLSYAWRLAYEDPESSASLPGDWHDRQRPGVVRRIKAVAGACSLENHQPGGEHHHPAPTAPLADALALIAGWWGARRDDTAPEPGEHHVAAVAARRTARRRP
ncbi:hypothetical protein [Actinopolymorpha pittospori]|uniref:Uncharacterized protein n=1 Tax=Actinopolymorpha pittospori TaxID=648752 RepID=A0A927RJE4_9ACTN|nr:hypothetical protein [Actinopolymorpha pittospori]MBE1605553.1 hypothetical protein [Actinopolymorpha pittospori]